MTTPRRWALYDGHLGIRCFRRPGRNHPACPACLRVVVNADHGVDGGKEGEDAEQS